MILFAIAYLGGAFTILSPCILPVLPFVFARADKPFLVSGLPLLCGMALTFAAVATLAAVGGGWAVQANEYGRIVAIVLLAFFGVTLLFPSLADRLTRPLVSLGARLSQSASTGAGGRSSVVPSFLLGIATGLLWAPCAGPILGLLLTGAALNGANAQTSLLLLAYAAGAATSLALALLVGGRVFSLMKRSLGAGEWIRRGLGAAVLCGVVAIALGLDTGLLTQVSLASTSRIEQALIDKVQPARTAEGGSDAKGSAGPGKVVAIGDPSMMLSPDTDADATDSALSNEGPFPSLGGATDWLNTPPLTTEGLRGKVVLVDFWTYSCINCLRSIPYVRAWAEKYKDQGLVVIGVHSPEFAFEKNIDNVRRAIKDLGIAYPVAIDNNYGIWRAFQNQYWPAHYFIDAKGNIRYHHFGEGDYDQSERVIQQLLAEAGAGNVAKDLVTVSASGAEAAADTGNVESPETYLGFQRGRNFVSDGDVLKNAARDYVITQPLQLNQWGLAGDWSIEGERSVLAKAGGSIRYRFHARDLHLVLGPSADGRPVRFRVTLDGKPPGADHGVDVDEAGDGMIDGQRLYQLVRQKGAVGDREFEIEFLDSGAQAFAFTFG